MKKHVIFIEHDHVSAGGPIWAQFERRGYEITRFIIVDEENAKTPNEISIKKIQATYNAAHGLFCN